MNQNNTIPAIEQLIPQKAPFVFVDNIYNIEENSLQSDYTVKTDAPLLQLDWLTEAGIMEHIAQSMAAYIGYHSRDNIKIGMVGAVKNFKVYNKPSVGRLLETEIAILGRIFTTILFRATVKCENVLVAETEMKVTIPE